MLAQLFLSFFSRHWFPSVLSVGRKEKEPPCVKESCRESVILTAHATGRCVSPWETRASACALVSSHSKLKNNLIEVRDGWHLSPIVFNDRPTCLWCSIIFNGALYNKTACENWFFRPKKKQLTNQNKQIKIKFITPPLLAYVRKLKNAAVDSRPTLAM